MGPWTRHPDGRCDGPCRRTAARMVPLGGGDGRVLRGINERDVNHRHVLRLRT